MFKLTEREILILQDTVLGLSNNEIGNKEFITSHTVKAHLSSAMKKLGAKNRAEAIYIAMKNNIIK